MSWHYGIMRVTKAITTVGVVEVYCFKRKEYIGWSKEYVPAMGETLEDLKTDLEKQLEAVNKAIAGCRDKDFWIKDDD